MFIKTQINLPSGKKKNKLKNCQNRSLPKNALSILVDSIIGEKHTHDFTQVCHFISTTMIMYQLLLHIFYTDQSIKRTNPHSAANQALNK